MLQSLSISLLNGFRLAELSDLVRPHAGTRRERDQRIRIYRRPQVPHPHTPLGRASHRGYSRSRLGLELPGFPKCDEVQHEKGPVQHRRPEPDLRGRFVNGTLPANPHCGVRMDKLLK
jgi:hypothetical protein